MSASAPAVGDRLRVVEKSTDGSTRVVTQGTVVGVDPANNRIDFGTAKSKLTSTAQVDVKVEALWPELPTTPGSVVKAQPAGYDSPLVYFLTTRGWIDENNTASSPSVLQRAGATVVLDRGKAAGAVNVAAPGTGPSA